MSGFIEGENRQQSTLFPERVDDYVGEDSPVRVIDYFIDMFWYEIEPYPRFLCYVLFVYMLSLLYLFDNFFQQDKKRRKALLAADKQKKKQK